MTARTREILSRFPTHLEAARPGKVLDLVVDSLAEDLDVLAARLAAVRRAHRLGEADEITDLLLLGALHGITAGEVELLFTRFSRVDELEAALRDAMGDAARDAAAEALVTMWGLNAARPVLPLFTPRDSTDLDAARTRLLASVATATRYGQLAGALRTRIARICRVHERGNGTIDALMEGAANALDLDIGPIISSTDRFWHAAPVFDRLRLTWPVPKLDADGNPTDVEVHVPFDVEQELLGLEENPIEHVVTDPVPHKHGDVWLVPRRGFTRVTMEIRVTGATNGRTIGPMVVNCDEGRGVGFVGSVPAGQVLTFTEEGRVRLGDTDMTSFAYAWEGACFNEAGAEGFVFDGPGRDSTLRPATFVTTTPAGALDREAVYPHGDITLPPPGIDVGLTRFAYFVQQAHFNAVENSAVRLVSPRTRAAFFDGSVFAPREPNFAGDVSFAWREHRPFSVRVLIPERFRQLQPDDAEGTEVRRRVSIAIERFRPAGVEVTVDFIDDRWVLGQSVIAAGEGADLIDQLRAAMVLWPSPEEEPR